MITGYRVTVYDLVGEIARLTPESSDPADAWRECLRIAAEHARIYPTKYVRVVNLDRVDLNWNGTAHDGLTEAEREQVWDAVDTAKAIGAGK